jgi:hypothetical protein
VIGLIELIQRRHPGSRVPALLGSARVPRAGDGVLAIEDFRSAQSGASCDAFGKIVSAQRRNQHARRVRYPSICVLDASDRGTGIGRGPGVTRGLAVGVGLAVADGLAVTVGLELGVAVGGGVSVGSLNA